MDENSNLTISPDEKLQAEINALHLKSKIYRFITIGSFVCGCIFGLFMFLSRDSEEELAVTSPPVMLIIVLSCIACLFLILWSRQDKKIKGYVSANITRGLLEEVFEVEEYSHGGFISKDIVSAAGLISGWDEIRGSDYVKGKYRGHKVCFSDVLLEEVTTHTDSDGNTTTTRRTIFRGPWVVFEHDRILPYSLRLREGGGKSSFETENQAFNSQFQILCKDGHTVFLVLTPQFMEYITSADVKARGQTYMCFHDNQLCLAIDNRSDLFEFSGKNLKDIESLRERHRADIRYITDILDELLRNDYLFNHKNPGMNLDLKGNSSEEAGTAAVTGKPKTFKDILKRLNPFALGVFAVYLASAVYALIRLPYGIVLSTDIWDPDAHTVSTPIYLLFATIFFLPLLFSSSNRNRLRNNIARIFIAALLLLIHFLFLRANIAG